MSEGFNIIPDLVVLIVPDVFHHGFLRACQVGYLGAISYLAAQIFDKVHASSARGSDSGLTTS